MAPWDLVADLLTFLIASAPSCLAESGTLLKYVRLAATRVSAGLGRGFIESEGTGGR